MKKEFKNYAFIDAQNLHMAIEELGWKIDYKHFRIYIEEHYNVKKAYMFMGFKPSEQQMYDFLQKVGYIVIFKPILELKNGEIKGNCDAELVLQAMIDYKNYEKAIESSKKLIKKSNFKEIESQKIKDFFSNYSKSIDDILDAYKSSQDENLTFEEFITKDKKIVQPLLNVLNKDINITSSAIGTDRKSVV